MPPKKKKNNAQPAKANDSSQENIIEPGIDYTPQSQNQNDQPNAQSRQELIEPPPNIQEQNNEPAYLTTAEIQNENLRAITDITRQIGQKYKISTQPIDNVSTNTSTPLIIELPSHPKLNILREQLGHPNTSEHDTAISTENIPIQTQDLDSKKVIIQLKNKAPGNKVPTNKVPVDTLFHDTTKKKVPSDDDVDSTSVDLSYTSESITLYEEFRLIERSEDEINSAWKGAHLLLFFLAFVFGSFCTFCFHVLMYLFDEKCVLFPKLLSLKEIRHSSEEHGMVLKYIIGDKDLDALHMDFITTQWVDISICYMPIYVPLLSGICGLVWTTMFLMCSSGSRSLTGLQRPWRILPSVMIFSIAMGGLCIYATLVTQAGLAQLCNKLGEMTGRHSCSYTINVATLLYERRIHGVYQAIVLTILSAWLHACCWLAAGLLALVRIVLVIDFRLVRIRADLRGNIEKMLERHEEHIRTDEFSIKDEFGDTRTDARIPSSAADSIKVRFMNKDEPSINADVLSQENKETLHYFSEDPDYLSEDNDGSLSTKKSSFIKLTAKFDNIADNRQFIKELLDDFSDRVIKEKISVPGSTESLDITIAQRKKKKKIYRDRSNVHAVGPIETIEPDEANVLAKEFRSKMETKLPAHKEDGTTPSTLTPMTSSSMSQHKPFFKSVDTQTQDNVTQTHDNDGLPYDAKSYDIIAKSNETGAKSKDTSAKSYDKGVKLHDIDSQSEDSTVREHSTVISRFVSENKYVSSESDDDELPMYANPTMDAESPWQSKIKTWLSNRIPGRVRDIFTQYDDEYTLELERRPPKVDKETQKDAKEKQD